MSVTFSAEPIGTSALPPPVSSGVLANVARAGAWFGRLALNIVGGIHNAMMESRYRRAAQQLRMFDNHMLKDIGITRSEIESIVRYGRAGDKGRF
jgi:uncharacterized protein YjiS (DUF1127 family)